MSACAIEVIGDGEIEIGGCTSVGSGVKAVFHRPGKIKIGDYCTLGSGVRFIVDGGGIDLGDWTSLHDQCLVLATKGVRIGQHGWFGQNTVLDGTGGLTIGNGVRVGMYSQIWTHVAAGEQIEGCTLYGSRPVAIEDDVWLVGSCICASGITIGRRSVALIGSNITKSWPQNSVLAGSPAARKESLSFYRAISSEEQWRLLDGWLDDVAKINGLERFSIDTSIGLRWLDNRNSEVIVFVRDTNDEPDVLEQFPGATICCLSNKSYKKRLTGIEHSVLKFLAGNKARFLSR